MLYHRSGLRRIRLSASLSYEGRYVVCDDEWSWTTMERIFPISKNPALSSFPRSEQDSFNAMGCGVIHKYTAD